MGNVVNGYSWVEGNTPNMTDPSGNFVWPERAGDLGMVEAGDCFSCIAKEAGVLDAPIDRAPPYNDRYNRWYKAFTENSTVLLSGAPQSTVPRQLTEQNRGQLWPTDMLLLPDEIVLPDGRSLTGIIATGRANRGRCKCSRKIEDLIGCYDGPPLQPEEPTPTLPPSSGECDHILTPGNVNSIGIQIAELGLWLGIGAGLSAFVMVDPNDIDGRYVVIATLESGAGVTANVNLGTIIRNGLNFSDILRSLRSAANATSSTGIEGIVFSEATLDQLTGASIIANLDFIVQVDASITIPPVGSDDCSLVSGGGSISGGAGVSLSIAATDVVYDSEDGRLFPNGFWR